MKKPFFWEKAKKVPIEQITGKRKLQKIYNEFSKNNSILGISGLAY